MLRALACLISVNPREFSTYLRMECNYFTCLVELVLPPLVSPYTRKLVRNVEWEFFFSVLKLTFFLPPLLDSFYICPVSFGHSIWFCLGIRYALVKCVCVCEGGMGGGGAVQCSPYCGRPGGHAIKQSSWKQQPCNHGNSNRCLTACLDLLLGQRFAFGTKDFPLGQTFAFRTETSLQDRD